MKFHIFIGSVLLFVVVSSMWRSLSFHSQFLPPLLDIAFGIGLCGVTALVYTLMDDIFSLYE